MFFFKIIPFLCLIQVNSFTLNTKNKNHFDFQLNQNQNKNYNPYLLYVVKPEPNNLTSLVLFCKEALYY